MYILGNFLAEKNPIYMVQQYKMSYLFIFMICHYIFSYACTYVFKIFEFSIPGLHVSIILNMTI